MSTKPPRATIHDVAALAGVSIKTVSRVLRQEAKVSPTTRAAVERAVREMGYQPDLSARSLKSNVPNTIGLVRSFESGTSPYLRSGHEYVMCLQVGALRATQQLDFGLLLVPVHMQTAKALREMQDRFDRRQVAGYLVPAPVSDLPGLLEGLTKAHIPYAAISPNRLDIAGHWVAAAEQSSAEALVLHLIAAGHKHIAYISGAPKSRASTQREAGWRDALRKAGITPSESWIEHAEDFTFDAGRRSAHIMFARTPSPTAVFAASDDIAAGVMNAAQERGMKLPEDLSVVGFDDLEQARKLWPKLTTVHIPFEGLGEMAARQLVSHIQPLRLMEPKPSAQVMLHCDLVTRGSVVAPKPSGLS